MRRSTLVVFILSISVWNVAAHQTGDPGTSSVQTGDLRAADVETRRDAVMRLAGSGREDASRLLVDLLDDPAPIVRATVAGGLGQVRAVEAIGPIGARLKLEKKTPFVRKALVSALGEIGDRGAGPLLIAWLRNERDREVIATILTALGRVGDPAAIDVLVPKLSAKDEFQRREAARSLGLLRARQAVPALAGMLRSEREADVRRCAAEALGLIGAEAARPALLEALRDPDPYVSLEAERALGRLRSDIP